MSARGYKEDLKRILGLDDAKSSAGSQEAKASIPSSRGISYYTPDGGTSSKGTTGTTGPDTSDSFPDDPTTAEDAESVSGSTTSGGSTATNEGLSGGFNKSGGVWSSGKLLGTTDGQTPTDPEQGVDGETLNRLEGLYDCTTGDKVVINFNGIFDTPEGWTTPDDSGLDEFNALQPNTYWAHLTSGDPNDPIYAPEPMQLLEIYRQVMYSNYHHDDCIVPDCLYDNCSSISYSGAACVAEGYDPFYSKCYNNYTAYNICQEWWKGVNRLEYVSETKAEIEVSAARCFTAPYSTSRIDCYTWTHAATRYDCGTGGYPNACDNWEEYTREELLKMQEWPVDDVINIMFDPSTNLFYSDARDPELPSDYSTEGVAGMQLCDANNNKIWIGQKTGGGVVIGNGTTGVWRLISPDGSIAAVGASAYQDYLDAGYIPISTFGSP